MKIGIKWVLPLCEEKFVKHLLKHYFVQCNSLSQIIPNLFNSYHQRRFTISVFCIHINTFF